MKKLNKTGQGYLLNTLVIVVLFTAFQLITAAVGSQGSFKLVLAPCLWQCCYLMILAASLNLVLGFLGQLSLGHCGFMAVGAYTAALLSLACQRAGVYEDKSGAVFILVLFACVIAAGLLAALIGLLVGIPALRLKGDYLAIITLGFGMIIINIINNLPFCGQDGLSQGSAAASLYKNGLGFGSKGKVTFLWVALLVTIVCIALMFMFIRSKYGRAIKAIRDDEVAAEAMGISLFKHKMLSFVISSFFSGVGGALFAMYVSNAQAKAFTSTMTYEILLIVVIGGIGSISGSVIGTFLYVACSEWWLRFLDAETYIGSFKLPLLRSGFRMVVFSIVIMIIVLFFSQGIMGEKELTWAGIGGLLKKLKPKKKAASTGKEG